MSYTVAKYEPEKPSYENAGQNRTYNIKYVVISSTQKDHDIHSARNASGMPANGTAYEYDSGVFVSRVSLDDMEYTDEGTLFFFNVEYSVSSASTLSLNSSSPINEPPKVNFGVVKYVVPFELGY